MTAGAAPSAVSERLRDVLGLIERGWAVFPCGPDKRPLGNLVEHGHLEATTHPRRATNWWRVAPDALIGIALPKGVVVVDLDTYKPEFDPDHGLDLPDTVSQTTGRGGQQLFYVTDGRAALQMESKLAPAIDTRVSGKGYVIAYEPDVLPPVDEIFETFALAPEWVYPTARAQTDSADDADMLVGEDGATHRSDLTTWVGRMRWAGATGKELYAALRQAREDGRIVDGDESRPWTDEDFRQLAGDFGSKPGPAKAPVIEVRRVPHKKPARPPVARQTATELLATDLRELEYLVEEILPEGLGVVAGAPKVGKSWLTFQAAVELATGGSLLGRRCEERPALYYGLEDGARRFKKRLEVLIGGRKLDLSLLELRYEAPRIGDGLEDDVCRWLDDNPGGIVFVDVLAKVRPRSTGRGNAYDEDYAVVGPLQTITKDRPGTALVVVTHDRKAASEDFLTTVTGTRGITGAADWIWVVKRDRLVVEGTIFVTGRDIEKDSAIKANFTGPWSALPSSTPGKTKAQRDVGDALRTEGDMTAWEIVAYLHPDDPRNEVHRRAIDFKLKALKEQGWAAQGEYEHNRGHVWHILTEDEREAELAEAREESADAAPSNGGPAIRRVSRARVPREGAEESHPSIPTIPGSPVVGMLGMRMSSPTRRRAPASAPAHTRGSLR